MAQHESLSENMRTYAILDEWMEKQGVSLRTIRENNRSRALRLMDHLAEGYGQYTVVPENHPDLEKIRFWLGAYEDTCTVTDISELQARVMNIAAATHIPVNHVLRDVAHELKLSIATFWKKMHHNEFTVLERRSMWLYISQLEQQVEIVKKMDSSTDSRV